jgi:hypothetical protein
VSDLERTIQIVFEADDKLSAPLEDMTRYLDEFGGDVGATSDEVSKLSGSIDSIPEDVSLEVSVSGEIDDLKSWTDSALELELGISEESEAGLESVEETLQRLSEAEGPTLEVDLVGDYEGEIEWLEESFAGLPDWKEVWVDADAASAIEGVDTLKTEIDDLPDDVDIDISTEGDDIAKLQKQIDLLEAKRLAIENGEGLIKIDSTGLEPALEEVMWQILEKVQIRAAEQASEFLLGLPA